MGLCRNLIKLLPSSKLYNLEPLLSFYWLFPRTDIRPHTQRLQIHLGERVKINWKFVFFFSNTGAKTMMRQPRTGFPLSRGLFFSLRREKWEENCIRGGMFSCGVGKKRRKPRALVQHDKLRRVETKWHGNWNERIFDSPFNVMQIKLSALLNLPVSGWIFSSMWRE